MGLINWFDVHAYNMVFDNIRHTFQFIYFHILEMAAKDFYGIISIFECVKFRQTMQ